MIKLDLAREDISNHILELLGSLALSKDVAPFTPETRLCDTGLDSVCMAYLIGDIQHSYGLRDALYKAIVKAHRPILTVRVSDVVDCVYKILSERVTGQGEEKGHG